MTRAAPLVSPRTPVIFPRLVPHAERRRRKVVGLINPRLRGWPFWRSCAFSQWAAVGAGGGERSAGHAICLCAARKGDCLAWAKRVEPPSGDLRRGDTQRSAHRTLRANAKLGRSCRLSRDDWKSQNCAKATSRTEQQSYDSYLRPSWLAERRRECARR